MGVSRISSHITTRIQPLSIQLANQIAAGEVVERPASVVKELLENSIDAHADQIDIDIDRGGISLIRINDNGDGIDKDDLSLAVTRHATSKLKTLHDLENVNSLGFRGEALASISAVSKLSIKSKTEIQTQAWLIDTGTDTDFADYSAEPEPASYPQGSSIEVRDLFYNTPARRKFMRTVKTEFRHIDDIVKRIALSQFNVAFKLSHNKKVVRHLPKAVTEKAIRQRISKLFSAEFISHTQQIDCESKHFSDMGNLRLWGWVSKPQWHRKQADWQYFYVNGRYIKDKLVNHALRQAYQELLPIDSYAAYILYLEIAPQQVDVNVHPTKHEVRFRQTRMVHDFIVSALNQSQIIVDNPAEAQISGADSLSSDNDSSIDNMPLTTAFAPQNPNLQPGATQYSQQKYPPGSSAPISQRQVAEQLGSLQQLYQVGQGVESNSITTKLNKQSTETDHLRLNPLTLNSLDTPSSREGFAISPLFGQPLGCFIADYLFTQKDSEAQLFVIDINKAQQFLVTQLFQKGKSKSLLIPESLYIEKAEQASMDNLLNYQTELSEWGLEFSQIGKDTILIRSLPYLYGIPACEINPQSFFRRFLQAAKKISIDELSIHLLESLNNTLETKKMTREEQKQLLTILSHQVQSLESIENFTKKQSIWINIDKKQLVKIFENMNK